MHPATASPTSVRTLVSDELASNAVSAAPSVVPTTRQPSDAGEPLPEHPVREDGADHRISGGQRQRA